jgi:hypothetical protein
LGLSLVYVVVCRLFELGVLGRGERSKELEILVLRHELSICAGRRTGRGLSRVTGCCSPRSAGSCRAARGRRFQGVRRRFRPGIVGSLRIGATPKTSRRSSI